MATTTNTISSTNPCTLVRQSCDRYVKEEQCQRHVKIHREAIPQLAQTMIITQQQLPPSSATTTTTTTSPQLVEWDEENWHYSLRPASSLSMPDTTTTTTTTVMDTDPTTWPVSIQIERTALYILALDAINFCFWKPQPDSTNSTNSNTDSTSTTTTTYKYEYEDLARTLTNMALSDHAHQHAQPQVLSTEYLLSPMHLQNLTLDRMILLFQKYHPKTTRSTNDKKVYVPPYMEERCRIWNEIGTVLMNPPFHGSILPLFQMVLDQSSSPPQSKASRMVQLLLDYFPNFRDDTKERYLHGVHSSGSNHDDGITIPPPPPRSETAVPLLYFYKRAQICVGDLYAALASAKLLLKEEEEEDDDVNNMNDITTFADYRVPQLLRHYQILEYSTTLAHQIDTYQELPYHSEEEYAIRASTIVAVELLVDELRRQSSSSSPLSSKADDHDHPGPPPATKPSTTTTTTTTRVSWNAMQADWYLWQLGEKMDQKNELLPHHRVRTTFY